MSSEELSAFTHECEKTIEHFRAELQKTKTGRASVGILDGVMVDYYGTQTPLVSIGLVNVAEARLLTIQVYDASAVESVEKAIHQSGLGLNPSRDGSLIRVPIPALTEERRKEIVKRLNKQGEEMKITIRNHRRAVLEILQKQKKEGDISEDDLNSLKKDVQAITDAHTAQIDELLQKKEAEVLEV
ncbi:MAG: ribosome recycling factor [Bdellovibrionota bacterium]